MARYGPILSGGQISSDAGLLTLRAFDERHHLTADLAEPLQDARDARRVDHSLLELLRQRLYAICAGYEDANDAQQLRHDPILKMVANKPLGEELASQPTLSRLENALTGRDIARLTRQGLEWFIRVGGKRCAAVAKFCWMWIRPTIPLMEPSNSACSTAITANRSIIP